MTCASLAQRETVVLDGSWCTRTVCHSLAKSLGAQKPYGNQEHVSLCTSLYLSAVWQQLLKMYFRVLHFSLDPKVVANRKKKIKIN